MFLLAWLLRRRLARPRPQGRRLFLERLEDRLTPSGADLAAAYGHIPLSFAANQGQAAPGIDFVARGSGYGLALTPSAALLGLRAGSDASTATLRMELLGGNAAATAEGLDLLPGVSNDFVGPDPS